MNKMQTVATSLLMLVIGMGLGGAALWGWQIMQPGAGPVASQPAAGPINPESAKVERRILYYRNPMGQPDTSPTPKKDEMGMDYIPVYADEAQDEQEGDADGRRILFEDHHCQDNDDAYEISVVERSQHYCGFYHNKSLLYLWNIIYDMGKCSPP